MEPNEQMAYGRLQILGTTLLIVIIVALIVRNSTSSSQGRLTLHQNNVCTTERAQDGIA